MINKFFRRIGSYTPAPDDVSTGSPGILSMAMAAVADHYNHPPQELIDAAEELISNVWEKNTFTNVADTAISSQHIFTSETVTPFAKANINTVAEGAVYGLKSAKTVAKSSVVGLTFAAADTYGDLTNENFTSVQKRKL